MVNIGQIGASFSGLKGWVKSWIILLVLANLASFFFLVTPIGKWTAAAAIFIIITNTILVIRYNGLTRVLAFSHLIWVPLIIAIFCRLNTDNPVQQISLIEFLFGVIIASLNTISLLFDINDIIAWLKGKREVLGLD